MKISIFGSDGFIGSSLCEYLKNKNIPFQIFNPYSKNIEKENLGVIIYLIGRTGNYLDNIYKTVNAHVSFYTNLLENAKYDYVLYFSSARLYDSIRCKDAREHVPIMYVSQNPRSLYDLSKALGENITLLSGKNAVLRLSNVYDFSTRNHGFLNTLLNDLKIEKNIYVDSSPYILRNYIFLDDLLKIIEFFIKNRPQGIYNIASPNNTSNNELKLLLKKYDYNLRFQRKNKYTLPNIHINFLNKNNLTPKDTLTNLEDYLKKGIR